jgi:hypothetical protein
MCLLVLNLIVVVIGGFLVSLRVFPIYIPIEDIQLTTMLSVVWVCGSLEKLFMRIPAKPVSHAMLTPKLGIVRLLGVCVSKRIATRLRQYLSTEPWIESLIVRGI